MTEQEKAEAKKSWLQAIRETIYGMAAHDMSRAALRTRASMEHLFILITMGDLLGVPILPPYYSLRLLPYVVPQIATWKRRMLREFIYGMTSYEFVQQALEMRASMDRLFMVGVFGDMLGVPILPPYYGLRLLPWVVPEIEAWKREVLRERELGSSHEHHLHGL